MKLYLFVQLWKLHQMIETPQHNTTFYSKKNFNLEQEQLMAAKEFFKVVYEKTVVRAHSIQEGKMVLLYDFISSFEVSSERVSKVTKF